jgi:acyl carrier protein
MGIPTNFGQIIKDYILSEFLPGEDPANLTETTPLVTTGILNSIATLKLVLFIEAEFSITLEPHELNAENLETIECITKLVGSKS